MYKKLSFILIILLLLFAIPVSGINLEKYDLNNNTKAYYFFVGFISDLSVTDENIDGYDVENITFYCKNVYCICWDKNGITHKGVVSDEVITIWNFPYDDYGFFFKGIINNWFIFGFQIINLE